MSFDQATKEAYASAPQDRVVFDTLEVLHSAFVDEEGQRTAIRVVLGYESITARLEGGAPLHGGQYVQFTAAAFGFSLPGFEEDQVPQMKVTLDGVTQEVIAHLEAAASTPSEPIVMIYRPFVSTDLSKPGMDPPIVMELTNVNATGVQITGTATLDDVHNAAFPREKYLPSRFPGLVR